MTNFSRESILKQEETLADIDNSIDDWIRKSEQAENRRSRVRQKLLEHVAAALTLSPGATICPRDIPEQHTPPESPEQEEQFPCNERHRVQSIKIYADAGVAALLAEIDQEIGSMEASSRMNQDRRNSIARSHQYGNEPRHLVAFHKYYKACDILMVILSALKPLPKGQRMLPPGIDLNNE
ncbi:MAG: hypothetical protein Q9226_000665 [Calogaya cf. arnoldii]